MHVQEECRHVFAFYQNKFLEALQKTTRISLDTLRRRTEEPQISKRNPEKIQAVIPLFYADLTLTIPTISLKPSLEEIQQILNRGVQMVVEILKRVVLWGQSRRYSFVDKTDDPVYKSDNAIQSGDGGFDRLRNTEFLG